MTTTTTSTTTHTRFLALTDGLNAVEAKLEKQIEYFAAVQEKQDARIKVLEASNKAKSKEMEQMKAENLAHTKLAAGTTDSLKVRQDEIVGAIRRAFAAAPDAAPERATTAKPTSSSNDARTTYAAMQYRRKRARERDAWYMQ